MSNGLKPIKSKLDGLKPFGHGRPIWNGLWFYLEGSVLEWSIFVFGQFGLGTIWT